MVILKTRRQEQGKGGLYLLLQCLKVVPLLAMVVYLVVLLFRNLDDNPTHSSSSSSTTSTRLQLRGEPGEEPDVTSTINTPLDDKQEPNWRSSHSAVLAMATNYDMETYQTFIGSLRATGYDGHIILGVSENPSEELASYCALQNVTMQPQEHGKYDEYKVSHKRFFTYTDWIRDCNTCTDGIMLTDFRDAFFQADPFATAVKLGQQYPIMVFEELVDGEHSATHWLTNVPVPRCRGFTFTMDHAMLCSGSTMGSREGILEYLHAMMNEIKYWNTHAECIDGGVGDDQSIHNYLYYTNQLNYTTADGKFVNAVAIPHRTGAIHVVGVQAARIYERVHKINNCQEWPEPCPARANFYVKDNNVTAWLPEHPGFGAPDDTTRLLDSATGFILNLDGTPSAQVHQVDRFNDLPEKWFEMMREKGWPNNKATFP